MKVLTLDVAISTHKAEGIKKVESMLPPALPNVRYIVSWQEHFNEIIPQKLLSRDDVEIHRFEGKGLSNNRNNALNYCKGDIVLIGDDDLHYKPDFSEKILSAFGDDETLDLALFKVDFEGGKTYPESDCILRIPYPGKYFVSSVEISFRRDRIGLLRFYPQLGLGAPEMEAGEDEFFVLAAIKRGLKCKFINRIIGQHIGESTGSRVDMSCLRGQGFVIRSMYPWSFIFRLTLKSLRMSKQKGVKFLNVLHHLNRGAKLSIRYWKTIPKCYRW